MSYHHYIDWGTIAAVAVALAALGISIYQAWLLRSSNTAEIIFKLDDRFHGKEFAEIRKRAAKSLKKKTSEDEDVEDVLDFFEMLGILVRRKILDKEIVWHTFFYWIHGYCRYGKDFIDKQKKLYPTRYKDISCLHLEMLNMENACGRMNETEWDDFLIREESINLSTT